MHAFDAEPRDVHFASLISLIEEMGDGGGSVAPNSIISIARAHKVTSCQ